MDLLSLIDAAFSDRKKPVITTQLDAPVDEMYADALAFQKKLWHEVTCAELEKYTDAPYAFNPEAFCYFLPGIYSASVRENRPDLLVIDSIIGMLDLGDPVTWDEFFCERWPTLTMKEYEATQHWLMWVANSKSEHDSDVPHPRAHNPVSRAFDTINNLMSHDKKRGGLTS